MKPSLSYKDEDDRCYGATGMAIGIVVVDGEDYIRSLSLDAPSDRMVEYTGDFFFSGNPAVSAKQSWNKMLEIYNISMVAMLSNMLCRSLVHRRVAPDEDVKSLLHDIVADEGRDACSLEDDEIDRIFSKNYNYLLRVFNHLGVQQVAHDFASMLKERRSLSRLEILEQLKALSMI